MSGFRFVGPDVAAFARRFGPLPQALTQAALADRPGDGITVCTAHGGCGADFSFLAAKGGGAPVIVKIASVAAMRLERERYVRFVAPHVGDAGARIAGDVATRDGQGALVYELAAPLPDFRGQRLLKDVLGEALRDPNGRDLARFESVLDRLFAVLPRLHGAKRTAQDRDFPDAAFGEVAADDPLGNWLCRLPVARHLSEARIVPAEETLWTGATPLRFAFFRETPEGPSFEVLDDAKITYVLTGRDVARRVAAGRIPEPGETVWVDCGVLPPLAADPVLRAKAPGAWSDYDGLPDVAKALRKRFARDGAALFSPSGIVHGDLHAGNVTVATAADGRLAESGGAWLIDYGRTRRDLIVHDFAVLESSVLSLACAAGAEDRVAPLRERIRSAALAAGVSEALYAVAAGLSFLVAGRLALEREGDVARARRLFSEAMRNLV